jgi:molybdopterin molybdotransferase
MLENTRRVNDRIEVRTPLTPGENVSKKGEDIAKGQVAVSTGTRLKPHHLGLIAALGIAEVNVAEKPKIAILATGDELVRGGERRQENQVFEVNKLVLSAMCTELDAEAADLGIAKDDIEDIISRLKAGFAADMIITSGGTSVGAPDLVPEAIGKIEKQGVIVHGIAMRPAMPTALAVARGKPIIVLSGNPVAAMIGFEVFARPLICKMLGMKQEEPRPIVNAKLARKVTTALGRKTFVRVRVFSKEGELLAEPVSAKGSGTISTMTQANGYVVVPENREGLAEGEPVSVRLFDVMETTEGHV